MKKLLSVLFVFGFLTTGISLSASAQTIYVKVRPVAPVVVRPVAPSPNHVWIAEEWKPNGGTLCLFRRILGCASASGMGMDSRSLEET